MFHFCKLQICCLITSIFLGIIYDRGTKRRGKKYQKCNPLFDILLILVDFEILFDGITAVTVNYLDIVPLWVNKGLHLVFYILLDSIVFLYFILTLVHTDNLYSNKKKLKNNFQVVLGDLFPALDVNGLTVKFPILGGGFSKVRDQFTAVDNVSFTLPQGKILSIMGESGCGKSPLVKALVGLNPIASGSFRIFGAQVKSGLLQDDSASGMRRVSDVMQMIFQDPYGSLNPSKTVQFIMEEPLKNLTKMTILC